MAVREILTLSEFPAYVEGPKSLTHSLLYRLEIVAQQLHLTIPFKPFCRCFQYLKHKITIA
jgi:hypothetical protein